MQRLLGKRRWQQIYALLKLYDLVGISRRHVLVIGEVAYQSGGLRAISTFLAVGTVKELRLRKVGTKKM